MNSRHSSRFRDREHAAHLLVQKLQELSNIDFSKERPLVLGVPRGAVPMAKQIADRLSGDLDLILVHKFSSRFDTEFALGSVTEEGDIYLGRGARAYDLDEKFVSDAAKVAIAKLQSKRRLYTPHRRSIDLRGRSVILVDDGIATGATMTAAVRAAREAGAKSVIVAAAVASNEAVRLLEQEGALVVVLSVPENFFAVSQFFEDFSEVTDSEVIRALAGEPKETRVRVNGLVLLGHLNVPKGARGLVLFAHGSGSGRRSPRNQFVAAELQSAGFGTFLVDLLDENESELRSRGFDIDLLTSRLVLLEKWIQTQKALVELEVGFFGASTGAAAAIRAAANPESRVRAIVSRGGRPDLAADDLPRIRVPTLLIVGAEDEPVLSWNRTAAARMTCEKDIAVIPNATHLFEEAGALEEVARLSIRWFERHLSSRPTREQVVY